MRSAFASYLPCHLAPRREVLLACIVVFIVGCAAGDGAADVAGEVSLDGQPLADGVIHFFPADGKSRTASTFVKAGKFQSRIPLGSHRVEISSVQARPLRPGQDADSATGSEILPAKYNTQTELTAEVKPGKNSPRFDLSSK